MQATLQNSTYDMLAAVAAESAAWLAQMATADKVTVINASFIGEQIHGKYEFDSINAALRFVEQAMQGLCDSFPPGGKADLERFEQSMKLDGAQLRWHGGCPGLNTEFFIEPVFN